MEKQADRGDLLLSEVFPRRRRETLGFADDSIVSSRTVSILGKLFGNRRVAATWVLSVFYLTFKRPTVIGREFRHISEGASDAESSDTILVTFGAPGFLVLSNVFDSNSPEVDSLEAMDRNAFVASITQLPETGSRFGPIAELLSDKQFAKDLVDDVYEFAPPQVATMRAPETTSVSAPKPPIPAERGPQKSTVGVLARDANGDLVVTTAYHGTGPVGTVVEINGSNTTISAADRVLDAAIAPVDTLSNPSVYGLAPMARPPSQGEKMYFCGLASGTVKETFVDAVDPSIVAPEPGEQVRIYTRNDDEHGEINKGDSGCALVDQSGHVAGFAFVRTRRGAGIRYSKWIWAQTVFDGLNLSPY